MPRRSVPTGTIFQTPNGRWVVQLELPRRQQGKRRRIWRRAATQAEAKELLDELRAEYFRTGSISNARRTVADACDSYLASRRTRPLSEGTLAHDDWLAGLLRDGLGAMRLDEVTVMDCDDYLARCADGLNGSHRPVGRKQIGRVRRFVVNVLNNEIRLGNLSQNVALVSELPATHDVPIYADEDGQDLTDRRALTVDELQAFLNHAAGSRLILADLTGRNALRPAEARSLRLADLDLDAGELVGHRPAGPPESTLPYHRLVDRPTVR